MAAAGAPDPLEATRERVRAGVRWAVTAWVPLQLGLLASELAPGSVPSVGSWAVAAIDVSWAAALWAARRRPRAADHVLLAGLVGAGSLELIEHGTSTTAGALLVAGALFANFLTGRRALPIALTGGQLLGAGALAWGAPALAGGAWRGLAPVEWARTSAGTLLVAALVVTLFDAILASLAEALTLERRARQREDAAHEERVQSLTAMAASQRLESLGRMAGGVAHDFNNALTVLVSGLASLRGDPQGRARGEILEDMDRALGRALDTSRQLLSFARQGTAPGGDADPSQVVTDLGRLLERLLPDQIRVEVSAAPVRRVALAGGELEQALLSVALNARDAMPSGGRLALRVRPDPEDDRVVVEVADRTSVAPAAGRPSGKFLVRQARTYGTGRGLDRIREVVEGAGGRIEVDEDEVAGTTVRFVLPVSTRPLRTLPPVSARTPPERQRLLFVEDDAYVRRSVARVLERSGFEVVQAGSVGAAAERLEADTRFDVLLTDDQLPDGNADAVIDRYRAVGGVAALVYSGYLDNPTILAEVERGKLSFLQKPAPPDVLVRTLRAIARGEDGEPPS
ncbi:MAG: response regulator [Polyangiaceae bacterium]|nr:response regulator [Polyangiaceae bacterium]